MGLICDLRIQEANDSYDELAISYAPAPSTFAERHYNEFFLSSSPEVGFYLSTDSLPHCSPCWLTSHVFEIWRKDSQMFSKRYIVCWVADFAAVDQKHIFSLLALHEREVVHEALHQGLFMVPVAEAEPV